MKFNFVILVAVLLLTLGATFLLQQSGPPRHITVGPLDTPQPFERSNHPAPLADFVLLDGTTTTLAAHKGKAVIVNFWASWCVPCIVEYPQMLRLAEYFPDELVILAISVDADRKAIDNFIRKYGNPTPNFLIGHDPEKKISQDLYGTVNLPESYLIDSTLIMRDKVIGASVPWDDDAMKARVRALLNPSKI